MNLTSLNERRIRTVKHSIKMSGSAEGSASTSKLIASDQPSSDKSNDQQKPTVALEEDDEFEDFPIEGIYSASHKGDIL